MKPLFIEASSPKGKNEVSTIQEDVIKSYEDSPQILISLNKESFKVGPFTMTFFYSFFSLISTIDVAFSSEHENKIQAQNIKNGVNQKTFLIIIILIIVIQILYQRNS